MISILAAEYDLTLPWVYVYNTTLITIVAVFWILVARKAVAAGRPWFPNLLILPLFFGAIGVLLNAWKPWLGTGVVGGLHVLLLLMLALRLSARRPDK